MKKNVLILLLGLGTCLPGFSQEEEIDLFDMSLEDLMNIEIVSASKKSESLFDAPLSSYSITREEIEKAGSTSIPEALRLCPGVIVREMTNGNYDIHLRGFDNIARYTSRGSHLNYQTLLMIDNRPVFNYTYGGIFWEALPVDIIDVERIEVVRGPSAPLFGPNAVTGVINIITRKAEKEGWYSKANIQYGNPQTLIGNVALGQKFNEKTSVIISGNYQQRTRHDDLYYDFASDQYLENVAGIPNADIMYPTPELALEKYGMNAFLRHQVSDQIDFDVSVGMQEAESQKKFLNSQTALGFSSYRSQYLNMASHVYGVGAKLSYTHGYDNFSYSDNQAIAMEFDSDIIDLVIDYPWQVTNKLQLRPSFNFQSATYDDSNYAQNAIYGGLFNRAVTISGLAGSLRADYQFTDAWRLIGSLRADKFAKPDDVYVSYQFASTYKVSDQYLVRAVYAKSSSSAFAINTSANLNVDVDLGLAGPGSGPMFRQSYLGNPDVELSHSTMAEIGFRARVMEKLLVDIEFFQQELENISSFVFSENTYQPSGLPAPFPPVVPATNVYSIENFPLKALQRGVTLSVNFVPTSKFQVRPFVTLQKTEVQDLPLSLNTLPTDPVLNPRNLYSGVDEEHPSTPRVYGGAFVHGAFTSRFQANVNAYYFGAHTLFDEADLDPQRITTAGEIAGKFLLNSKVSYRLADPIKVYFNVRNLLGNDSREYYGTDRIGRTFFVGANFSL